MDFSPIFYYIIWGSLPFTRAVATTAKKFALLAEKFWQSKLEKFGDSSSPLTSDSSSLLSRDSSSLLDGSPSSREMGALSRKDSPGLPGRSGYPGTLKAGLILKEMDVTWVRDHLLRKAPGLVLRSAYPVVSHSREEIGADLAQSGPQGRVGHPA